MNTKIKIVVYAICFIAIVLLSFNRYIIVDSQDVYYYVSDEKIGTIENTGKYLPCENCLIINAVKGHEYDGFFVSDDITVTLFFSKENQLLGLESGDIIKAHWKKPLIGQWHINGIDKTFLYH